MFKLAELFVAIKAEDGPYQKSIGAIKGGLTTMASTLGSQIGGAFLSIAGGPIGLATSAVTGLLGTLNESSEEGKGAIDELASSFTGVLKPEIEGLKSLFQSSIEPIKAYVASLGETFTGFVEVVKETFDENSETFARFALAAYNVFDTLKIGVMSGVEYFQKIRATWVPIINEAIASLQRLPAAILAAFGSENVEAAKEWGAAIQTWVIEKVEQAGLVIRNWPTYMEIATIKIYEKIINIGEYFSALLVNAQRVGEYLANNWRALAVDAFNAVGQAIKNLGENLANLSQALIHFVQNPTGGFEFAWKPLLDGFKATADKLPEMIKAKLTALDITPQLDAIAAAEASRKKPAEAAAKKTKAVAEEVAASGDKFKSQSIGVAEFASKLREGIFSDKDDTPKKTLAASERTAAAAEETAKNTAKKPGLGP